MKNLKKEEKSGIYAIYDGDNALFCPFQFPTLGQAMDGNPSRQKEACCSLCSLFNIEEKSEAIADVTLCHAKYENIKVGSTKSNNVRKLL